MPPAKTESFHRDIATIWKFVAIVGAVVLAIGGGAGTLVVWGTSLEKTDTAHELRIKVLEDAMVKLQRQQDRHERQHQPPARP